MMPSSLKRAALLAFIVFTCWFCQKKIFGYIEVHGRLIHFFTHEPVATTIDLLADDATSAKNSTEHSIALTTETSKADGTFSLRSKPSKRGVYYLNVHGEAITRLNVSTNQNNDLGDITVGRQLFTCKIKLVSKTDSCIALLYPGGNYITFAPGMDELIIQNLEYSEATYEGNKHNFIIYYSKGLSCNTTSYYPDMKSYALAIPITSTDTLNATITY